MKQKENTMITLNEKQQEFVNACTKMFPKKDTLDNAELLSVSKSLGMNFKPQWLVRNPELRVGRGTYKIPTNGEVPTATPITMPNVLNDKATETPTIPKVEETTKVSEAAYVVSSLVDNLVPNKDATFVPFGNHPDVRNIVKSKQFYPIFITGLSGNGKTFSVVQAAAEAKRELIRVNITIETDEDDLLGGYRLRDGQTVWQNGPVIEAMERGAILLLDEVDLASNKIMCLQPILEGNGVYVKKINKFVKPSAGFNVVATANTKGQGSDDGKFIGTNILNEAFLERFPITMEQPYPALSVEKKIVLGSMTKYGKVDEDFADKLVTWAEVIRKTYFEGAVDELISTRRLDHIVKAYTIFKDKLKAIEMCTNRFDEDTKTSFLDLYSKVDAGVDLDETTEEEELPTEEDSDMPY